MVAQAKDHRSAATLGPCPPRPHSRGAGRTIAVIAGAIAAFVAVLAIAGGVVLWANNKKDDDGYISTSSERFSTSANAIATNLDVKIDAPGLDHQPGPLRKGPPEGQAAHRQARLRRHRPHPRLPPTWGARPTRR